MKTRHKLICGDSARSLGAIPAGSVSLVVTSPPYPMVEMWDETFGAFNPRVKTALGKGDGTGAHEEMNRVLDLVWIAADRVISPGGTICVNIGDATRTVNGSFRVYDNHTRVSVSLGKLGYSALPEILWRKPSNKPNKFMGSGMLPPGAYVTQEHEYILVFRKGLRKEFSPGERMNRRKSAFFWEERNLWFSDVWHDLHGERQDSRGRGRSRSAAYPFELAYRLVNMFSVKGDVVLDPFAGTGTTALAAMAAGRDSLSVEVDPGFRDHAEARILGAAELCNEYIRLRLKRHAEFAEGNKALLYTNARHGFPVMTRQETELELPLVDSVSKVDDEDFEVEYSQELLATKDIVRSAV